MVVAVIKVIVMPRVL